ncbi:hypothetical protein CONPUDRAFT_158419 [Coniophora puteana RWD-64-598 SS2]|uniref:DUF6533 domain-containing protein n=1 Tax=Coniophora puteana (strain RWD-64-598) TaxID=741705 RepID=A0A5M3MBD7_CONPW|nr:uncharacterized protein CONPUDRAFT_158419 [Coniophora puteana RWD-64-598 SS2]EIW76393.1 hypothetical protein CONPUDRAFT_158419 [Coniophora puteana RWD-64-598 SS2]
MSQLPSTDQEPTPAEITSYIFTTTYSMVAGLAVVVYDQVLSIGSEVELVWKRRSSTTRKWLIKAVFYAALRYGGLLWSIIHTLLNIGVTSSSYGAVIICNMLSDTESCECIRCYRLFIVEEITLFSLTFLLQGMMSVRVWILLGMQREVYVVLLVTFVATQIVAVAMVVMYFVAYAGPTVLIDEGPVKDCFVRGELPSSWGPWLIPLNNGMLAAYELLLCAFAIYYLVQGTRTRGSSKFFASNLVFKLVRDNLVYFFLAFFILLITTLEQIPGIEMSKGLYWTTFATLRYLFYGLVGPWMVLDLRREAYEDQVATETADNNQLRFLRRPHLATSSGDEEIA